MATIKISPVAYVTIPSARDTVERHADLGWQCPECYGVRITTQYSRFQAQPTGFVCDECGCQFGGPR